MAETNERLKPCPWGCEASEMRVTGDWMAGFQVVCPCGASGPNHSTESEAVARWNCRPPDSGDEPSEPTTEGGDDTERSERMADANRVADVAVGESAETGCDPIDRSGNRRTAGSPAPEPDGLVGRLEYEAALEESAANGRVGPDSTLPDRRIAAKKRKRAALYREAAARLRAGAATEHVYDEDGDCDRCGTNRIRCEPVEVRTVSRAGASGFRQRDAAMEELSTMFGLFRRDIRHALFPVWPNNLGVGNDEILEAIHRLVDRFRAPGGEREDDDG